MSKVPQAVPRFQVAGTPAWWVPEEFHSHRLETGMIERIDHFVLTVRSLEATCAFYARVLGFERIDAEGKPTALAFGAQKINVHEVGHTFEPKALRPTPGAADFCLIATAPLEAVLARLSDCGVAVEAGPVERVGARGAMTSVYFRDPDANLVEVSRYHVG